MNCETHKSDIDITDPFTTEALYLVNTYHLKDRVDLKWIYYEILEKPEMFRYLSTLKKQQFLWRLTRVLKALHWTKVSGKNSAFWVREYKIKRPRRVLMKFYKQIALTKWLENET